MYFSITDTPPKGTKKYITPQLYEKLTDEERYPYSPDYLKYRTVKVRNYSECDCCGHKEFMGWVEEQIPIGEPYRYVWRRPFLPYGVTNRLMDQILNSNVIATRILGNKE